MCHRQSMGAGFNDCTFYAGVEIGDGRLLTRLNASVFVDKIVACPQISRSIDDASFAVNASGCEFSAQRRICD